MDISTAGSAGSSSIGEESLDVVLRQEHRSGRKAVCRLRGSEGSRHGFENGYGPGRLGLRGGSGVSVIIRSPKRPGARIWPSGNC